MDLNVPKANVFQLSANADMHMIALQAKNAIIKVVVLTSVMGYFVLQLIDVLMVNVLGYVKIQGAQMVLDVIMVNANQFKGTVRPLHNAETLKFAIWIDALISVHWHFVLQELSAKLTLVFQATLAKTQFNAPQVNIAETVNAWLVVKLLHVLLELIVTMVNVFLSKDIVTPTTSVEEVKFVAMVDA